MINMMELLKERECSFQGWRSKMEKLFIEILNFEESLECIIYILYNI